MPSAVPPGGAASPLSPPRTVEITEHQLAEWKETAGAAAQRELVLRQQLAARGAWAAYIMKTTRLSGESTTLMPRQKK